MLPASYVDGTMTTVSPRRSREKRNASVIVPGLLARKRAGHVRAVVLKRLADAATAAVDCCPMSILGQLPTKRGFARPLLERLRYPDGRPVECVIPTHCIGGVAEAAEREGVGVSITAQRATGTGVPTGRLERSWHG